MSLLKDINEAKHEEKDLDFQKRRLKELQTANKKMPAEWRDEAITKVKAKIKELEKALPLDMKEAKTDELAAWKERFPKAKSTTVAEFRKEFPKYYYRPQDDVVSLKLEEGSMSLIKELAVTNKPSGSNVQTNLKASDKTDAGSSDVSDKARSSGDISFSLMRNTINADGSVSGSDVANYIERAEELNDEVDTVPFGLETDDGKIVKVYVNAEQADKFEEAMKNMLGLEDDIEEAINRLTTEFDIVDVVWPKTDDDGDGQADPDADLSLDDTADMTLDPEDEADFADDNYDVVGAAPEDKAKKDTEEAADDEISAAAAADAEEESDEVADDEKKSKKKKKSDDEESSDDDAPADDEGDDEGGGGSSDDEEEDPDDPEGGGSAKKKKKKKKAQPAEPVDDDEPVKESKEREVDSPSIAAAIKKMTSKGLHIKAMDEDDDAVYIEDDRGDEYVMRGDTRLTKEKHGRKLTSYSKNKASVEEGQEKTMTIGSRFLSRIIGEGKTFTLNAPKGFTKDMLEDFVERQDVITAETWSMSGGKIKMSPHPDTKWDEDAADDLKAKLDAYAEKQGLTEAVDGEDRDGVKDGFNVPLDSQARALVAKLKLPFAKRLVAFFVMSGVPGRYLNTEDVESGIAGGADMLRKKVSVRRAFSALYEGLANAKGFAPPKEKTNEAKKPVDPEKMEKAKAKLKAAKKALADHNKTYDGGTGARAKSLQADIDKHDAAVKKLKEEHDLYEAKQKRGSFIQKLFETVLVELGLPQSLITTTGPAAVGTGIYRTAEMIEQDADLERALRLLATRLGVKQADAAAQVDESKEDDKYEIQTPDEQKVYGPASKEKCQARMDRFKKEEDAADIKGYKIVKINGVKEGFKWNLSGLKMDEEVDVGNDEFSQAVVRLVAKLGIPDDVLQRRRTQIVQALRGKRQSLRNRAQVLTMMTRLEQLLDKNTQQQGGQQNANDDNDQ